jgi:hypothetical protein
LPRESSDSQRICAIAPAFPRDLESERGQMQKGLRDERRPE